MAGGRVIVLGGGAVGVATAAQLQEAGFDVLLVERAGIGEGCSSGNSGLISMSGSVPLGSPALIRSLPRLLVDRSGPLTLDLAYLPRVLPWFARMVRASSRGEVVRISEALARLLEPAQSALISLAERAGCSELIRRLGTINLFETEESFDHAQGEFELRRSHGVAMRELSGSELRELEPALSAGFNRGILIPDNAHCLDPMGLVKALFAYFQRCRGRGLTATVTGIAPDKTGVRVHTATGEALDADYLVVAAGAWSAKLLRPLGVPLLLAPHRGYHIMLRRPGVQLNHPLMWGERGFAMVPMRDGIRAAGLVEIADPDAKPDFRNAERILQHVRRALPGASVTAMTRWMGVRPATPDSMPLIGPLPRHERVLVAAGHGHIGLTLSAITGQLITELISARRPLVDLASFSPARFA